MKKLTIKRTTLRHLTSSQLGNVAGGGGTATQVGCNTLDCQSAKCQTTDPVTTTTVGHG